ncbi:MAG: histone deacetylase [Hyphomicrobiaceae bacterium]
MTLRIYYPDTPDLPLPPGHRFPAHKYRLLREAIAADRILDPAHLMPAPQATVTDLCRAHDEAYVAAMLTGTVAAKIQREIGLPWSEILVARSRATVGGAVAAARHALDNGVSGQLAGGTHHAHRSHGRGFCVFNDCAVTALTLLDERAIRRAAILDLDVHQGDGNAAILGREPRVFTASVHGASNYPFVKPASTLDIGLPDHTGDEAYLAACQHALAAVLASNPDLILYISGVDPLATDRLGRLAVTHDGLIARDRAVFAACRKARVPVVILIGGGYADPITETVSAYANSFRTLREVYG